MTAEVPTPTGRRRAALAFIFLTVTLDMLALGVIIPVLPKLVESFVGGDIPRAAIIVGLMGTVWAVMQFFFSPVQGALSDRFGRRPVVLLSNFGLGLDYILMALAPNLSWLFVGRAISGITAASFSTAGAYIADVTPPEKRAAGFGMLGAAFGIGFILGPAIGGLLGSFDPRLPFWTAAGLSLVNGLYGLLILPESLPKERRSAFSWRRANPVGSINLLSRDPALIGLSGVVLLSNLAHQALPSIFVLYATYRYDWDQRTIGLTLAGVGVSSMIVQGGLVRPIVAKIGERASLLIGLVTGAIGFAIYGLADIGPAFWMGIPIMAFWGLASPSAQGLMTRHVAPTEQGRLQGAIGAVMGFAGIIGPYLFSRTFSTFIGPLQAWHIPGAAFLLAALLLAAGALLGWRITGKTEA
ncbi:MAG TPA: TCR/Tet family MFS transporter [Dongiaceae bacterium]|jgi:DHA1 family tetracycline resistance protein-like MFS transporter